MTARHQRRRPRLKPSPAGKHHLTTPTEWEWTQVVRSIKVLLWVISEVVKLVQTLHGLDGNC